MLSRYRVSDLAHRVVGIGSGGTRTYLALLMGKDDKDPLFLQIKKRSVRLTPPTCRSGALKLGTMASASSPVNGLFNLPADVSGMDGNGRS